jgi:hypothetical protein
MIESQRKQTNTQREQMKEFWDNVSETIWHDITSK